MGLHPTISFLKVHQSSKIRSTGRDIVKRLRIFQLCSTLQYKFGFWGLCPRLCANLGLEDSVEVPFFGTGNVSFNSGCNQPIEEQRSIVDVSWGWSPGADWRGDGVLICDNLTHFFNDEMKWMHIDAAIDDLIVLVGPWGHMLSGSKLIF